MFDVNQLIGQRVMHKRNRSIGTITNIDGKTIEVSFYDDIHRFSFPEAFSSILELEDEELHETLNDEGMSAGFESFKGIYKHSIWNEIQHLKETGGKRYKVVDGELLSRQNNEFLYAFDTDTELHFPDGTPIKLWREDGVISAYVISCEEFTIVFRTNEWIGDNVEFVEFTAQQWQLLECLSERLEELSAEENPIAYEIACRGKSEINECARIQCGQSVAVKRAISETVTFIWGPPGTGKTQTLANIALDYIEQGKRVLMLSYSNVSVDGALLRVAENADYEVGVIVRYGYPRVEKLLESKNLTSYQIVLGKNPKLNEEHNELILEKKKLKKKDVRRTEINRRLNKIREQLLSCEKELIQSAAFVATTVSKAVADKAVYSQQFDVVIFDEISMAYVPQVVFAASLAKCAFVGLGDFCQLPAIVQNPNEHRLVKDIFEYTSITDAVESGYGHNWLVLLNAQFRMHPDIAEFAGKFMYNGQIETSEKIYASRYKIAESGPLPGNAMGLVDLSHMYSVCIKTNDGSRINLFSALLCISIAERLAENYEVGIITPYNAQSRLIMAMIRDKREANEKFSNVTCATVHQFQGSEKAVIIYDAVDCFRMPYPGTLLTSMKNNTANRLFNVALTRAQGKFLLVANCDFMKRKKISKNLMFTKAINEMQRELSVLNGDDAIEKLSLKRREETWVEYIEDVKNAKKEIYIEIPGLLEDNEDAIEYLASILAQRHDEGVNITIRHSEEISIPGVLKKYEAEHSYVTMPVTVIDRKTVWYGHPVSDAQFISEGTLVETLYFPCLKFEGIQTAKSLRAFLELGK